MAQEYKLSYTASEINQKLGAVDNKLDASALSTHNTSTVSHNDIRELISGLSIRLNTVANSDDTTLDQMSEIVAYIKANKGLIDGITTSKVNVADIVDNLTTSVSNKPLSAKQGVALKSLIDTLTANKLDASSLTSAIEQALVTAKASGEFDGKDGVGIASISQSVTSTEDDGINVITVFTDDDKAYNFEIKNGSKGSSGANGKTPVKGTDYFTPVEKEEMVNQTKEALVDIYGGVFDNYPTDAEIIAMKNNSFFIVKKTNATYYRTTSWTRNALKYPNGSTTVYVVPLNQAEGEIYLPYYGVMPFFYDRGADDFTEKMNVVAEKNSAIMDILKTSVQYGTTFKFPVGHFYFARPLDLASEDKHISILGTINASFKNLPIYGTTWLHFENLNEGETALSVS